MERIIHIARIRHGDEADVRRALDENFPAQAIAGAGIREFNVFVGSGYVVTQYEFPGEYTPTFRRLWEDPSFRAWLDRLGTLLDERPAPLPDEPGGQYVASQALHWDGAEGVKFTPHIRPKEASRDRA